MTTDNWIALAAVLITVFSGGYFIIMVGVDRKIGMAVGKMRDEQLNELKSENRRKEERIEKLREQIKDMK